MWKHLRSELALVAISLVSIAGCGASSDSIVGKSGKDAGGSIVTPGESVSIVPSAETGHQECELSEFARSFVAMVTSGGLEPLDLTRKVRGYTASRLSVARVRWVTSVKAYSSSVGLDVPLAESTTFSVLLSGSDKYLSLAERKAALVNAAASKGLLVLVAWQAENEPVVVGAFDEAMGTFLAYETCDATFQRDLRRVQNKLGGTSFEALVALSDEVQRTDAGSPGPLEAIADGYPVADPVLTADEVWYQTDPAGRTLAFADVPKEIKPRLAVAGIQFVVSDLSAESELYVRCDLGVGWASSIQAVGLIAPVVICRDSPSSVVVDGKTIATFDSSEFDSDLGNRVSISVELGVSTARLERLQPGDLERILGVTTAQLETLKQSYGGHG